MLEDYFTNRMDIYVDTTLLYINGGIEFEDAADATQRPRVLDSSLRFSPGLALPLGPRQPSSLLLSIFICHAVRAGVSLSVSP